MFNELLRGIRNWWIADRIRITPGHCRLFQLTVGARVLVRDRLWVVVNRNDSISEETISLEVHLEEFDEMDTVEARLGVTFQTTSPYSIELEWSGLNWQEAIFEEDVVQLKSLKL